MEKLPRTKNCLNCGGDMLPTQSFCSRKCYLTMKWDSKNPLFKTWEGMMYRCLYKTSKDYGRYGGRGITICLEWRRFKVFQLWATKNGFSPGLKIERRNNNKGYYPGNCKFSDSKQQARNRRNNTLLTAFGETKTVVEWSEDKRCVVNRWTLAARVTRQKLTHEIAITHPLQKPKGGYREPIVGSVKHQLVLQARTRAR